VLPFLQRGPRRADQPVKERLLRWRKIIGGYLQVFF
jgi:hypothetical protein